MKIKAFVVLATLFLGSPVFGQQRCTPVYETTDYTGPVESKTYKIVQFSDGRQMTVPVINGVVPSISEYYHNGAFYRTYTYPELTKKVTALTPAELKPQLAPMPTPVVPAVAPMPEPKLFKRPAPSATAKPIEK